MKRLLIVGDMIPGSGLTEFIFNVFTNFDSKKYKISVIGYGKDPSKRIDFKCQNLDWTIYRVPGVTNNPIKHWLYWIKIFKHHKFDIAYFNYSSTWNFLPIVIAKYMGAKKIVCHSHNTYFSHLFSNNSLNQLLILLNDIGRFFFQKYSDIRVATSADAATWMFGKNIRYPVSIISNGIDLKKFIFNQDKRGYLRRKISISSNQSLIGFVGVLEKRKNPLFALKVFELLLKQMPDSKFLIIGSGPMKHEMKNLVASLGMKNSVIMLEYSPIVNEWYSAMDALIFPSLFEGFGLVPLEAQVSNLPVIVSENIPNEVLRNCNSLMKNLKNGDQAWANELVKILENQGKIDRKIVNKELFKFSADEQSKKINKLLGE